ncbi:MAG: hypothetical protein Sylvanvirus2_11 [Sylvanvirus sp.]|uniref:Uncharacterized protein n=1 Tax=Sylvanvirus sp. TaxID=2487774 RepID=A0A3G5AH37_9VIRU|nr:MAG: hypothetical protein Sylvanvirus2_11 [Sylvanvirus sp.]
MISCSFKSRIHHIFDVIGPARQYLSLCLGVVEDIRCLSRLSKMSSATSNNIRKQLVKGIEIQNMTYGKICDVLLSKLLATRFCFTMKKRQEQSKIGDEKLFIPSNKAYPVTELRVYNNRDWHENSYTHQNIPWDLFDWSHITHFFYESNRQELPLPSLYKFPFLSITSFHLSLTHAWMGQDNLLETISCYPCLETLYFDVPLVLFYHYYMSELKCPSTLKCLRLNDNCADFVIPPSLVVFSQVINSMNKLLDILGLSHIYLSAFHVPIPDRLKHPNIRFLKLRFECAFEIVSFYKVLSLFPNLIYLDIEILQIDAKIILDPLNENKLSGPNGLELMFGIANEFNWIARNINSSLKYVKLYLKSDSMCLPSMTVLASLFVIKLFQQYSNTLKEVTLILFSKLHEGLNPVQQETIDTSLTSVNASLSNSARFICRYFTTESEVSSNSFPDLEPSFYEYIKNSFPYALKNPPFQEFRV